MNEHESDRLDAYLWDPAEEPHEDVRALEHLLAGSRFRPTAAPWSAPATIRRRMFTSWRPLAIAATVVLALGTGLGIWRWTWPAGRAWTIVSRPASTPDILAVGRTLQVPESEGAVVNVARIGTMRVAGGSAVTLRATGSNHHRLTLERGSVHVRVWAPPFSVAFQTPAGDVRDLGCEFDLDVVETRARVRVTSGWVQLENDVEETLVPAGASSEMNRSMAPGVPVFDDAATGFRDAVRMLEGRRESDQESIERVARLARPRDVLTLLMLIERRVDRRETLAARAAELWPPPNGVTVARIVRGDREALWRWRDTLPLPPTKGWWLNWQDALPSWLARKAG
jgi:hypothetical protein